MDQANDGTNHHANGEHHHHHLDLGELGHDMGLVMLPHMIKDPMLADPHIPQVWKCLKNSAIWRHKNEGWEEK